MVRAHCAGLRPKPVAASELRSPAGLSLLDVRGSYSSGIIAPGAFHAVGGQPPRGRVAVSNPGLAYPWAMVDENIIEEAAPYAADPPNANRVYRNYLLSCRRQGIEPVPRKRAVELMQEWANALKRPRSLRPVSH